MEEKIKQLHMNDLSDLRVWAQGSSSILAHTGLGLKQLSGKKRDLSIGKIWAPYYGDELNGYFWSVHPGNAHVRHF